MIDRRRFLYGAAGCSLTVGMNVVGRLASASTSHQPKSKFGSEEFDESLAGVEVELLGVPRSTQDRDRGLHPFWPERVLVSDSRFHAGPFPDLKERLLLRGYGGTSHFSKDKLDYILWTTSRLTRYYRVPDYSEDWAMRLAAREDLGVAMGGWKHCGFIHQFQPLGFTQPVTTKNGLVDWWLFLVRDGIDFQSQDGLPTHVLFGCVEADSAACPERQAARLGLLSRLAGKFDDWCDVSRMDRVSAAHQLNRRLAEVL